MKLNQRSLAFHATCDAPADNAGFQYKKGGRHAAHHRRWSVPRGTLLFCFGDAAGREPVGVIILEGCTVELVEAAEEFAFAVRFAGARAHTYVLEEAESQAAMEGWVKALSRASFDYLRLVVRELGHRLAAARAGSPLPPRRPHAIPPKEDGCALWSAEIPAPAAAPAGAAPRPLPGPEPPATTALPAGLGAQRASRLGLLRPAARVVRAGGQGAEGASGSAARPSPEERAEGRNQGEAVKASLEASTGPGSGATAAPGPALTGPALRHRDLVLRAVAVGVSPEVPAWSALADSGSEKMLGSEGCFGTSVIQRKPSLEEAIVPDPQENPGPG